MRFLTRWWRLYWNGKPKEYDDRPFCMEWCDIEADSGFTNPGWYFVWDSPGVPCTFGPYYTKESAIAAIRRLNADYRGNAP